MLMEAVRSLWGLEVKTLEYAPLGLGSHHWTATCSDGSRRFLTADHLPHLSTQDGDSIAEHFEGFGAAFETARELRAGGLEFVLASEPSRVGAANVLVADEWSIAVFPFIEGEALGPGTWHDNPAAAEASYLVGRLHGATPPACLRRWTEVIPHRNVLQAALLDLDQPWRSGPLGEPARALLAAHRQALQFQLAAYDRLVEAVMKMPEPWVVSTVSRTAATSCARCRATSC